ncbi:MAG: DNA polymerase IV [Chloroflexota bacterium]|nr:DNA polymerase IV [Chloroflexota bacterium]MDE2884238.1 DNA polymerase IV [Chloroflexota bacterium]
MTTQRYIALLDLDAFYASVEVLEEPSLDGKPLLIGGSPQSRGVVAAASYEARKFGCHSAMPMSRAVRLCPEAIVLPPRFHLYREYSGRVMDILQRESGVVQQMSIDEAYVDLTPVSSDMQDAVNRAHRMQGRIRVDLGLPCSVGVASNKMVAKVACETGKPGGFVVVEPGTESAFLADLDVRSLPGIGPRSTERLKSHGYLVLGQIASAPSEALVTILGPWGAALKQRARGEDPSPVHPERETKSVSAEETFAADVSVRETLVEELRRMGDRVARSLEKHGLVGRTVTLKLRLADFTTITRSTSRENATAHADAILADALHLLDTNWDPGTSVRLIGVGVSNLRPIQVPGQLALELSDGQREN